MDCKECHERFRADKMIEDFAHENGLDIGDSIDAVSYTHLDVYKRQVLMLDN